MSFTRTEQQIVKTVNGSTETGFSQALSVAESEILIISIQVTPSLAGGQTILKLFDDDGFTTNVYELGPAAGVLADPVKDDDTKAPYGFILPYHDEDDTDEIHFKIDNQDTQQKDFTIDLVYLTP